MTALEEAAREYQDALAAAAHARKVASRAQEHTDRFIADAEAAQHRAQLALEKVQDAALHYGRDF